MSETVRNGVNGCQSSVSRRAEDLEALDAGRGGEGREPYLKSSHDAELGQSREISEFGVLVGVRWGGEGSDRVRRNRGRKMDDLR